ncbi:DUF7332 family protein [Natronobacterium gregoryi]|uniref:Uncharacterized protein n=2 Tax=Natronobacterium gregoryi TaxID=44930 RepID=L0AG79_NATGS|nr:hypothetical protein [Natronobacterium gregoryi]AFZ72070.1 hypothetical protein Natgr_0829 [Natronobacterium gregoryi SP2]ELY62757.1 hypothetical protein C490_17117 [Natronobacterium gregoryi SP2]PLK20044.1 hypothetical protein CYV19_11455 [Natronobacterium gregoryi SP2]SFJ44495.1 hypothetical protein SAMN05443661_13019 [Natronobacterium gregoryi]
MRRVCRPGTAVALVFVCFVVLTAGPVVAETGHGDRAAGVDADSAVGEGCLGAGGTAFTIGSDDSATIWVRLHFGLLTDSGGSIGAELVGATTDGNIVEIVAGVDYVADDFDEFTDAPLEAFAVVTGYEFQLPMFDDLESAGLDEDHPPHFDEDDPDAGEELLDGPFEHIEC